MTSKPHFSLLATSFAGGPRPRKTASILFGLWFLLFFAALFSPPLLDDADATHASAARAIAETGDLVTLRVDGVRYLEKAPLPYWLAALSFRIFGFNTFAAHLPQAVAVLLLMLLGFRWANQAFGARTAYYTGLGLLTSFGVFLFTRVLIPEALLSLCLAASLFAFLRALGPIAIEGTHVTPMRPAIERPSIAWYAGPLFYPCAMWGSLALAVLAKGLVAPLFFFATTFVFLLLTGELSQWRKLKPFTGILVFLVIAAPWHVLAALRSPGGPRGGAGGHGFLWFYFVNEHWMRFLGQRIPRDYNKLPGYLYWTLHLIWLFPWALFLPLGIAALIRRYHHQVNVLSVKPASLGAVRQVVNAIAILSVLGVLHDNAHVDLLSSVIVVFTAITFFKLTFRRSLTGLEASPFHRIDPQQRTILLLSLFAAIVLIFFSLSTNQEYYTFPAYLPLLLLIAATITRAEQTYASDSTARRAITAAHAAFATLGLVIALLLVYGLWSSRNLQVADIGSVLAHRGVGDYTLSLSTFFDLTTKAFATLRLPALLAALAFAFGPALAWMLRTQRRHLAATTSIALTAAGFLFAAHLAFARFGMQLSSRDFANRIQQLATQRKIAPDTQILLFGDQAYGSSIPFYLNRQVLLVDGRTSSMYFGSTFPDAPPIFLTGAQLQSQWGHGPRKLIFVPVETRPLFEAMLGTHQIVVFQQGGKNLYTDRILEDNP